ncbi:5'-nucleotidase [hydrocarbon metagenome]|uniref:5'-nucleotidase n=1 Tax=hydrocarbon metagenome TaxID=938273 RepID=A0A0W8FH87_9ZZZZ
MQSRLAPYANETGEFVGGISRISALVRQLRTDADGVLLVSTGNDMMGHFYHTFQGEPEMKATTAAGYDAACPGNHEFDFGSETYANALRYAGFPVVCANINPDNPTLASAIRPSVILTEAGVRIGVFGLMTPDLALLSAGGAEVSINPDVAGVARTMADSLRSGGADLVIAVTQIGPASCREIAGQVDGIDLIVDGDGSIRLYETVDGPRGWRTIIVCGDMRGERLGLLEFTYSGGGIDDPVWTTVCLDGGIEGDPAIDALLQPYYRLYRASTDLEIGETGTPLDTRKSTVRTGEAAAGNLIADAWRDRFPDADVAFVNSGSIRTDTVYPAGPISSGMVAEILPFEDTVIRIRMTGKDILQALEMSASALGPDHTGIGPGGFLQVSGLCVTIDMSNPPYAAAYEGGIVQEVQNPGSRVVNVSIEREGMFVPLDPDAEYVVLVNRWLAGGGDGYTIFASQPEGNVSDTTVLDRDALSAYIQKHGTIAPVTEGRISIINAGQGY